jgi:lambda family phage tail tape measure protein
MSNFFDYASKGFLNFGSLAESVMHEVYMQIVRMQIVAPLTKGIMGGLTSFFSPSNVAPNLALSLKGYATGGVFTNSIVKEPTYFAYGDTFGSSLGVMGEAGAEAVMPLTRIGGDLGVKAQPSPVVLNITNNSGQDIDAKMVSEMTKTNERGEQERVINIVIDGVNRNVNGIRDALRVAR